MIPAGAVEAAAEYLPHSDDCEVRPERDCTCWQPRVNIMREALEAAAPHMQDRAAEDRLLAMAWNEGAMAAIANPGARLVNPYKKAPNAR